MAIFKLQTTIKKSCIETTTYEKDGKTVNIESGYRWASYIIEAENADFVKQLDLTNENGMDPYSIDVVADGIESVELDMLDDQCWVDITTDGMDEDEEEDITSYIDDEGEYGLEEDGWEQIELVTELHGPLVVLDEDGNEVARGVE